MNKRGLLITLFVVSTILAACAKQTPEPVSFTLEMSEYAFTPNTIEAKVGQEVTIKLVNKGVLEHEIMFGRDVMMINNQPDNFQTDMFQMAKVTPQLMQESTEDMSASMHGTDHTGFMIVLPKTGDEATLTFIVTEDMLGEWEFGCFSQEGVHYNAGMQGKFIVKS